jgi:hypothetical protein
MKNNKHPLYFLILTMMLCLPTLSHAKKTGTESGGGGGVSYVGLPYPVLMDYFTIVKSVEELPVSQGEPSRIKSETRFSITSLNEEEIKKSNPAFGLALGTISHWSKLPFDVMSYAVSAAFEMPLEWSFTNKVISAPPFYGAPSLPKNAKNVVAAYYLHTPGANIVVSISRNLWNQMQLNDQAGLLIHEALRNLQIGFKMDYNDQSLQRATAIYQLCKPTGRLNYYMHYILVNSPEKADQIYGSFDSFIQQECRMIE